MIVTNTTDLSKNQISFELREKQLQEEERLAKEQQQRDKNSPYRTWSQYNLEHTKEVMNLIKVNPNAARLLFFLVDQMDTYNAVMCSYTVFEEALELSKPTVTRAVKALKELGFIHVYKSGTSNVYAVNDNVFWKAWGNKKKYSKFPANIILAESEQAAIKGSKVKQITLKEDN